MHNHTTMDAKIQNIFVYSYKKKDACVTMKYLIHMKQKPTWPSAVKNNSTANTPAPSNELTALYATSVASFRVFQDTLAGALTMWQMFSLHMEKIKEK